MGKRRTFVLSLLVLLISVLSCAGGGGDSAPQATPPVLSAVSMSPSSVIEGTNTTITGTFSFSDSGGDLNGGSLNYTYGGSNHSLLIPASYSGVTSGTGSFYISGSLSTTVGNISIPCWLVDRAGNASNVFTVVLSQTGHPVQIGTSAYDYVQGLAATSDGDVYLVGATYGSLDGFNFYGSTDAFIVKFDASKNRLWTVQFGTASGDSITDVAVDTQGNLYVAGITGGDIDGTGSGVNAGSGDVFLAKYTSSGARQWIVQFGTTEVDSASKIALYNDQYLYVTGATHGDIDGNGAHGGSDIFLAKYDTNGSRLWIKQFGTTTEDQARGLAVDSSGNPIVAGDTGGGLFGILQGATDLVLLKYDSAGTGLLWSLQEGTTDDDIARGVTVDGDDNIYIAGLTLGMLPGNTTGSGTAFLRKYNTAGVEQWTRQFGTPQGTDANDVKAENPGNYVYVTGNTSGNLEGNIATGGSDAFVAKYDAAGTRQWTKQTGTASNDEGHALAIGSNHIYIGGYTYGSFSPYSNAGQSDIFYIKSDTGGIIQ
jgi:hypothetical protein